MELEASRSITLWSVPQVNARMVWLEDQSRETKELDGPLLEI